MGHDFLTMALRPMLAMSAVLAVLAVLAVSPSAQSVARIEAGAALGSVTLTRRVMADGHPLAAGTYQVRLTGEFPKPGAGQSPDGEIYVEFLKAGNVVGREVATVVSNADIATVVKAQKPAVDGARVELLRGNDYLRVWINRGGNNYLINMPTA
jgi:hypothetical protein